MASALLFSEPSGTHYTWQPTTASSQQPQLERCVHEKRERGPQASRLARPRPTRRLRYTIKSLRRRLQTTHRSCNHLPSRARDCLVRSCVREPGDAIILKSDPPKPKVDLVWPLESPRPSRAPNTLHFPTPSRRDWLPQTTWTSDDTCCTSLCIYARPVYEALHAGGTAPTHVAA